MVGHSKNVSSTFEQMPYRNINVEFTIVCPHYCQYDVSGSLFVGSRPPTTYLVLLPSRTPLNICQTVCPYYEYNHKILHKLLDCYCQDIHSSIPPGHCPV